MLPYYIEYSIAVCQPFPIHGHACIYVLFFGEHASVFVNLIPITVAMYVTTILDHLPQIGKAL